MSKIVIEKRVSELRESDESTLKREIEQAKTHAARVVEHAAKQFDAIKTATGIDLLQYGIDDEVIAAIKAYRAVRGDWRTNLASLRKALASSVEALDKAGFSTEEQSHERVRSLPRQKSRGSHV
jgi:hypothetical protein